MKHRKQHDEDSEVVYLNFQTINRCKLILDKIGGVDSKDSAAIALIQQGISFEQAFLFLNSDWSDPIEPSMKQTELIELLRLARLLSEVFIPDSDIPGAEQISINYIQMVDIFYHTK